MEPCMLTTSNFTQNFTASSIKNLIHAAEGVVNIFSVFLTILCKV